MSRFLSLCLVLGIGNCYAMERSFSAKENSFNKTWYKNIALFCADMKQKLSNNTAKNIVHHGLLITAFVWYVSWYRAQLCNERTHTPHHMGYWLNFVLSQQANS